MRTHVWMHSLSKAPVDRPSIRTQKAVEVIPQDDARLLVSAPGLNGIHRELVTAEGPHPPQPSSDLPAGFVRCHAGRAANLLYQLFISGLSLSGRSLERLRQPPRLTRNPKAVSSTAAVLPCDRPMPLFNSVAQRHRPRSQLRRRAAHRIPKSGADARPCTVVRNACTGPREYETRFVPPCRLRYLGLVLASPILVSSSSPPQCGQQPGSSASRVWSITGGSGPATTAPIPGSRFPPRLAG